LDAAAREKREKFPYGTKLISTNPPRQHLFLHYIRGRERKWEKKLYQHRDKAGKFFRPITHHHRNYDDNSGVNRSRII
jgi:hypothetical protein